MRLFLSTAIVALSYIVLLCLQSFYFQVIEAHEYFWLFPFSEVPSTESFLPYYLNDLFFNLGNPHIGVAVLHGLLVISVFLLSSKVIDINTTSNKYLLLYAILFSSNVLLFQQVFYFNDTTLFMLVVSLYFFASCLCESKLKYFYLACIGVLGWYSRPSGIVFLVMLLVQIGFDYRLEIFQRVKQSFFCALFFILCMSPMIAYNYIENDFLALTSATKDYSTYHVIKGNNALAYDLYPWVDLDYVDHNEYWTAKGYKENDIQVTFNFIANHPGEFLWLNIKKILVFFSPFYTPLGGGTPVYTDHGATLQDYNITTVNSKSFFLQTAHVFVFVLFFYYLFVGRGETHKNTAIMTVLFLLFHLAVAWPETRYRVPFDPIIYSGAVLGIFEFRKGDKS